MENTDSTQTPVVQPKKLNILNVVLFIMMLAFLGFMVYRMEKLDARLKVIETALNPQMPEQKPLKKEDVAKLFVKGNMAFGDSKSKVLAVEISDPSCPFCHAASYGAAQLFQDRFKPATEGGAYIPPTQELRKLAQEGKVGFVTLYANGHGNGTIAAQALYCAYEQGKYWEAHDMLYSEAGYTLINDVVKNDKTKVPEMVAYLATALDQATLSECLTSAKYAKKLQEDMQTAADLGLQGTPLFIINTTRFSGAYSFSDMTTPEIQKLLDTAQRKQDESKNPENTAIKEKPTSEPTLSTAPNITIVPTVLDVTNQPLQNENSSHRVTEGDTLWDIAEVTYKDPFMWKQLAILNALENPGLIFPNQVLKTRK